MKLTRYLIVDHKGRTRAAVRRPPLAPGEYAFLLKIVIPDNPRTFGPVDLVVPEDEPPSMEDVAYEGEGPDIGPGPWCVCQCPTPECENALSPGGASDAD